MVAPVMIKNVIEDRQYEVPRYDELVNEQLAVVVREEVALKALELLEGHPNGWISPGESRRDAAARLSSSLLARRVPDSTYISVALDGSQPQGLAATVNAVVD